MPGCSRSCQTVLASRTRLVAAVVAQSSITARCASESAACCCHVDAADPQLCRLQVLGRALYFKASGSFSRAPSSAGDGRCPQDFNVAIANGGFVAGGREFVSDAISGPGFLLFNSQLYAAAPNKTGSHLGPGIGF